jgi:hypothetical protein
LALPFSNYYILVHHSVNGDDRQLLAHAMASDFTVAWQFSQRVHLFFSLQIKLQAHAWANFTFRAETSYFRVKNWPLTSGAEKKVWQHLALQKLKATFLQTGLLWAFMTASTEGKNFYLNQYFQTKKTFFHAFYWDDRFRCCS